MFTNMLLKTRYWIFAGVIAAIVGLSGASDAQAQGVRYDRDRYGDGWTWYEGNQQTTYYRGNRRGYDRDYNRNDNYYRSYYRGDYRGNYYRDNYRGNYYRGNYYRGNRYRGNGVRVGPVQVWW